MFFSVFIGVGGGLLFGFLSLQEGVFCTGVSINNVAVGNMSVEQALITLQKKYPEEKFSNILLSYQEKNWLLKPQEINLRYDWQAVMAEAFLIGRQGSFLDKFKERYAVKKNGYNVPLAYKYDQEKLSSYLKEISQEVEVKPIEAQLLIKDDNTIEIKPEVVGLQLNLAKALNMFKAVIKTEHWDIALPVEEEKPKVTEKILQERGIRTLLGSSASIYSMRNSNRAYNIQIAARAIDGIMLAPGEVFSFNKIVGARSQEAGYKTAGVIVNNQVVDGLGGGVCQVSSTLYNAVLLSNLQIVERTSHSRPVSYYPLGLDATVAYNYLDFKFKNNTPYYVIIKASSGNGRVAIRLFGHTAPPAVSLSNQIVNNISPTSKTVKDASLPSGHTVVEKRALNGYRVETWCSSGGKKEKVATSFYAPVSGVIRVGTQHKAPEALHNNSEPAESSLPVNAE